MWRWLHSFFNFFKFLFNRTRHKTPATAANTGQNNPTTPPKDNPIASNHVNPSNAKHKDVKKGITIEKIQDDEHFEHTGEVRINGDIGKNACVIIKDGSLIVGGNIGTHAKINLSQENNSVITISSGPFFKNQVSIVGISTGKITVHGNLENGVTISAKAADINIHGSIGSKCKLTTQSGDIIARNIGSNSTFNTMSGNVDADNIAPNCSLKTKSGNIKVGNVAANCLLETKSGDVNVTSADKSVVLETISGNIYKNGVRRKEDKAHHHATTNLSITGAGVIIHGSRVIVNGNDITDLVNANSLTQF